jgi:hypothetical protein
LLAYDLLVSDGFFKPAALRKQWEGHLSEACDRAMRCGAY